MRSAESSVFNVAMSFWAIAVMRFLSRTITICPLPAICLSSQRISKTSLPFSTDFENQLAVQMAAFADPVSLRRVGELIAGDPRRRYGAGFEQRQHPFQMRAVRGP